MLTSTTRRIAIIALAIIALTALVGAILLARWQAEPQSIFEVVAAAAVGAIGGLLAGVQDGS